MDDVLNFLDTIFGKVSVSLGSLAGLIVGIFAVNRKLDERIDKRACDVAIDEVVTQHDECRAERAQLIKECFDNNPRIAMIETNISNMDKSIDGMNGKLDTLLNLHLNGGRK